MPSDTFLRLNDDKKRKLLEASFKEFSLNNFNDVSINRIIKEAGISRGSFYMYFVFVQYPGLYGDKFLCSDG